VSARGARDTGWDPVLYGQLVDECYGANDAATKGSSLENFLEYCFSAFPGLTLLERDARMGSQELDFIFWNDKQCDFFTSASAEILVECKNWDARIGSAEVAWFIAKMRQRRVSHGFLVTRNGITGECRDGRDGALDFLYQNLADGLRPVVVTLDELAQASGLDELTTLFKHKVGRLFVRRL
jgi:hypothetical protein